MLTSVRFEAIVINICFYRKLSFSAIGQGGAMKTS